MLAIGRERPESISRRFRATLNAAAMGRGEAANKKKVSKDDWERKLAAVELRKEDLNQLVMNFLVTEGYVEAAQMFESESGTKPGVDLGAITERMHIRKAVQSGNVEAAIEAANDLDPQILEEHAELTFHLQQQRLIELIRGGDADAALAFAQEILAPLGEEHPTFLAELERTIALLAFEDVKAAPMADLLDIAQRQKTASELNAAILASQDLEPEPRLPGLLKMLLWAQQRLDERMEYPKCTDLVTAALSDPGAAATA